jgi:hypothetical protein
MSERRACRVIDADRKSERDGSTRDEDGALGEKLRNLADHRRRFGYRRLHILLRRIGVMINHTKPIVSIEKQGWRSDDDAAVNVQSAPERRLQCLPCRTSAGALTLSMTRWPLAVCSACLTWLIT